MSRPIPHIGRTLAQLDKTLVRRRLERQLRRLHAEKHAAEWQPTPAQFVADNDDNIDAAPVGNLPSWKDVLGVCGADMAWTAVILLAWALFGLVFAPAAQQLLHALRTWLA